MAASRNRARRRRRGFTLIEVMVSIGVMTVGAMVVLSLQQHAIRANIHARQLTIATQIAQRWIERFKQDAHSWTQVANTTNVGTVLQNTDYLNLIATNPDAWQALPNVTVDRSSGFDFLGHDLDLTGATNPDVEYCVAFRPSWVYFGRALRADVRVYWARRGGGSIITTDAPNCLPDGGDYDAFDPGGEFFDAYHQVYLSTVLRVTEVR